MPTQIALLTELSREKLLELRDEIDELLGSPPPRPDHGPAVAVPSNGNVEEMARRLRGRAGPDLQNLVSWLVKHYPQGSFVWEEVAAGMNEKLETVKSWHRSVSKPLNRLGREFPGAPPLLSGQWDGKRNHYTLNSEWVDAIKKTWA
jgi:hypothetical protein